MTDHEPDLGSTEEYEERIAKLEAEVAAQKKEIELLKNIQINVTCNRHQTERRLPPLYGRE